MHCTMQAVYLLIAIALFNAPLAIGSRILVLFYHPGPSHFHSFSPLFRELAERGHNVTVLSYNTLKGTNQNYNELLLTGMPMINATFSYELLPALDRSILTMHAELFGLYQFAEIERESVLKSPHIDSILAAHRQEPFDLVIVEQFITDVYMGLIHKLNVPFIGFSTCALPSYYYNYVNLPDTPSYVPFAFSSHSWDMNWYERTVNWFTTKSMKFVYKLIQRRDNEEIRKRFGDDMPSVEEVQKSISLTFVNQHYSYMGPKPLSNQLIELAGLHIQASKPLPDKFKQILDSAKEGVLLVSWGGNMNSSSIPEHLQQEMIEGFAKLPLQVIWKFENLAMQKLVSKNVHVVSWLPQKDILCHPNTKVFWTHGGNLGTIESVHCGRPTIITPFYGDQFLNAAALSRRGMGIKQELMQITADNIYNNVQKLLEPKATEAAQKVSYELRNRLNTPLETAVWWVEHTIATSGFELGKGNTIDMHWFVYYSYDAITIVLLSLYVVFYISKFIVTQLLRCCWTRNTVNADKKRN